MADQAVLITDSRHPRYTLNDTTKFRLTYMGGRPFIEKYLQQFNKREEPQDFEKRKCMSHNPGYAAQALDEIIAGITQRMGEITRSGGTDSYNRATGGLDGGVDLQNNSMNTYQGQVVLPELLSMGRVGVYVDMPKFNPNSTLADLGGQPHPYLQWYRAEDILNWQECLYNGEVIQTAVLLRERHPIVDPDTGLQTGEKEVFRLARLTPQGVSVRFYEQYVTDGSNKERILQEFLIPSLKRLPFFLYDIGKSLLTDAADIQVGLLNLASADLYYAVNSNFPFYVEGYDPITENVHGKTGPQTGFDADGNPTEKTAASSDGTREAVVGTMHGRLYPYNAPPPQFIHPSPEPLRASMEKQEAMKQDIRRLLNLNASNVAPSRASTESKKIDQAGGLEAGLSSIGIELETGERVIALIWGQYEGQEISKKLVVKYPNTYSLKSDGERIVEAESLQKVQGAAPSKTFNKELSKLIVRALLAGRVSQDTMKTIDGEIDKAKYQTGAYEAIKSDHELGLVDSETAAEARGYDPELVKKAQEERVKRMADTALAQSVGAANAAAAAPARGGEGNGPPAADEKTVSQNADTNISGKAVRQ